MLVKFFVQIGRKHSYKFFFARLLMCKIYKHDNFVMGIDTFLNLYQWEICTEICH
jgi:hypothetical protein